jgi:outer membrane protein assembly factor BamE
MRKLLIPFVCVATQLGAGCSGAHVPFVYRQPITQGNVVTQDMVARLSPGMSKDQVSHVLGSPLIVDTFNPQEWVYYYSTRHTEEDRQQLVVLEFEGEALARVRGEARPASGEAPTAPAEPVTVPLEQAEEPGLWERMKRAVGLGDGD